MNKELLIVLSAILLDVTHGFPVIAEECAGAVTKHYVMIDRSLPIDQTSKGVFERGLQKIFNDGSTSGRFFIGELTATGPGYEILADRCTGILLSLEQIEAKAQKKLASASSVDDSVFGKAFGRSGRDKAFVSAERTRLESERQTSFDARTELYKVALSFEFSGGEGSKIENFIRTFSGFLRDNCAQGTDCKLWVFRT